MGNYLSSNHFPVDGKTIVITGGSSGMGLSVGQQLAGKGANVVIVARDQGKLLHAIEEIRQAAKDPQTQRFLQLPADLTVPTEPVRVIEEIVSWNSGNPPDTVWCCAGASIPGLFIETPLSDFQAQMNSNYFSSLYMAHTIMRTWIQTAQKNQASSSGEKPSSPIAPHHLIFTASFLAFYSFTGYSPYSPTKAALRSLCDTLSQEANLYAAAYPNEPAIRLHTIFPATIFTASYELENTIKADVTKKLEETDDGQTPEVVAAESIKGLESGLELVSTNLITSLVQRTWLMGLVMVFVRGDMDIKVRKWGREHGAVGRKTDDKKA
ncbi:hypothetical protein NPX13_g1362 [Xylaria arbuscula]|uniref:3-dehydrosphinganine reductase n=1 Tax=Xylaria arbuscula TaxID=114810 RepID=A0A9W8TPQ5_9PEZI|nr:hypothetical protein NPX13_g1362 [Xylaria arbuscula]